MNRFLGLLCVASTVSVASADVLYSNDFSSNTTGITSLNSTTLAVATDANFGTGEKVMTLTGTGGVGASIAFSAVTLNVGDSLAFTFDLKARTAETVSFRRFAVGLYDSTTLDGYVGLIGYSSGDSTFQIRGYDGTYTTVGTVGTNAGDTTGGSTTGTLGSSATYVHRNMTYTILRTVAGLDITYSGFDTGGALKSTTWSITGGYTNTFDHVSFSTWGNNSLNFNMDNVALTYTAVPEPATYGLVGASLLAGCAVVRRRRKLR